MELFKLLGTIAINNTEANQALRETGEEGSKAESKLSKAFGAIGSAAAKVGKVMAVGMAAGTAAIAKLTKDAMSAYADYEQLVGGVETLFGTGGQSLEEYAKSVGKTVSEVKGEYESLAKAEKTVLDNADKAYKTAGMSANEYMETVTSFSASLIQGLGGDTEKAAQIADKAIVDMSDNANKMGTSMGLIQNAYQGFAKQNYTMLDNLKLGYGGTQAEMARLINDSGVLGDTMEVTAKTVNEVSFDKIIEAIHVIQTEMGITGTTAKEASETISGSFASMKSAWQNLVIGFGNDTKDLDVLINQFVDSAMTVADNVIPRLEIILGGIAQLFTKLIPKIAEMLPGLLNTLLPILIDGAIALMDGLVQAMPSIIEALMNVLPALIEGIISLTTKIVEALPDIIRIIIEALPALIPILVEGITTMIVLLCEMLPEIIQPIIDNLPMIITAIVDALMTCLPQLFEAGVNLLLGLFEGMLSLIASIPQILMAIFDAIVGGIKALFGIHSPSTVMMEIGRFIMEGLLNGIQSLMEAIRAIWNTLKEITIAAFNAIKEAVFTIWNAIKETISTVLETVKNIVLNAWEAIKAAVSNALEAIKTAVITVMETIKTVILTAWEAIKSAVSAAMEAIRTAIITAWEAIKSAVQTIIEAIRNIITTAWEAIKTVVSTVMETIKTIISTAWETIKTAVSGAVNFVKETISNGLNAAKEIVSNVLESIKEKFTSIFDSAKEIVSNAIETIKGFFDFEWKLPDIKLPHFSINGSFSLNPPSIPSFGVEWYKDGGIMNDPTIFGFNPMTNKAMVGGEAGAEAIAPIDTLQSYVREAVGESNSQLYSVLNAILSVLSQYLPEMANMQLVMDTGEAVGALAPAMDEELGRIAYMRGRTNG